MKKTVTGLLLSVLCGAWFAPPGMAQPLAFQDSPFGIFGPYVTINEDKPTGISKTDVDNYLKDVGAKWVEEMPKDSDLDEISTSGVNIYSRIGISNQQTRDAVRKYKDKVKYWEAGTEPDGVGGWKDNPTGYVAFLKDTYTIVKEECADCYLVPGGLDNLFTGFTENSSSAKFLKAVLQAGGGKYFDVFEFKQHAYTAGDYPELKNKMAVYGKIFAGYGLDIKKMPVFLEIATYDGTPSFMKTQSEAEQASGLLKTYVYGLAQGIDKIFWNLVIERHNFANNSAFNYYGLVNNPDNDGFSHKKLAYYTYKKMTEVLEGADWSNIQTVQESGDVYVYKFNRNGTSVYVAWWDYFNDPAYTPGKTVPVTLTGLPGNTALATEAVPQFSSGAGVTNYNTAFRQQTLAVTGGTATLQLGESPVFVEGPAVSLRVNGNPNVTVTVTNPVTVDYTIRGGAGQEFFLVLDAPAMGILLSYRNAAGQWVTLPANLADITLFTTALADVDRTLYTGTVPAGVYSLCLGYDTVSNGRLNLDAVVYDCVEATVR